MAEQTLHAQFKYLLFSLCSLLRSDTYQLIWGSCPVQLVHRTLLSTQSDVGVLAIILHLSALSAMCAVVSEYNLAVLNTWNVHGACSTSCHTSSTRIPLNAGHSVPPVTGVRLGTSATANSTDSVNTFQALHILTPSHMMAPTHTICVLCKFDLSMHVCSY